MRKKFFPRGNDIKRGFSNGYQRVKIHGGLHPSDGRCLQKGLA
jgi:hypothetical protein